MRDTKHAGLPDMNLRDTKRYQTRSQHMIGQSTTKPMDAE